MDPKKAAFLFPDAPATADLNDPVVASGRLDALPDDESGSGFDDGFDTVGPALRRVALRQVLDEDPPETWAAARRLLDSGMQRDDVVAQLVLAMLPFLLDPVDDGEPDDPDEPLLGEGHRELLDRLPLPTPGQIGDAIVDVARNAGRSPPTTSTRWSPTVSVSRRATCSWTPCSSGCWTTWSRSAGRWTCWPATGSCTRRRSWRASC